MRVVLFGATGMVGHGVLTALLEDPSVQGVTTISRRNSGRRHPKLREVLRQDFTDYADLDEIFGAADAALFCLGTPSVGLSEPQYTRITRDFAVAAAEAAWRNNPDGLFVYVSANRADSSSSTMWIRVKGRAEEALTAVHSRLFFVRPGFIRPLRGARPATRSQRAAYAVLTPFYPLIERRYPDQVTTTDAIAYAILEVLHAPDTVSRKLDNPAINKVAILGIERVAHA
ncbi:NAD(P)H-binding protein [Actinoplanes sp. NBRC 103695]|uniref:NAD-dependent epimerase/dehydratase family protein n=1 Tax=Actinoplanes sp. NBRC 103695 TaxID=3032202 RepID=UPI0024A4B5BF|nr:NAD(P)H-binding protein [Actinoplanes sp. NBRC 103695]GLZ00999.1 epimerase [Actinoplanes sp. NBRC 103695]